MSSLTFDILYVPTDIKYTKFFFFKLCTIFEYNTYISIFNISLKVIEVLQ